MSSLDAIPDPHTITSSIQETGLSAASDGVSSDVLTVPHPTTGLTADSSSPSSQDAFSDNPSAPSASPPRPSPRLTTEMRLRLIIMGHLKGRLATIAEEIQPLRIQENYYDSPTLYTRLKLKALRAEEKLFSDALKEYEKALKENEGNPDKLAEMDLDFIERYK